MTATLLGAAVAATVAGAVALHEMQPDRAQPGRAPWTVAGIALCRGPFDLAGYLTADGRVVFPITHPERPMLDRRPARCFSSYEQAAAAGYRIAPAPPGATVVGRAYLVPAAENFLLSCRTAERKLSFGAPCPRLLPAGAAWTCRPCVIDGTFVLSGVANAPAGYSGVSGGGFISSSPPPELRVTGGSDASAGDLMERFASKADAWRGSSAVRWARTYTPATCSRAGADGNVSYAVSLHGSDARNRPLLRALIAAVREGR